MFRQGDPKGTFLKVPEKRLPRLWLVTIPLFAVALYANALRNGFVYDDVAQVVMNPWIKSIGNIAAVFTSGAWGFSGDVGNYYRPLMHIFYMLVHSVFGLNPLGFHLFNILLHAGNSALVFFLTSRLLPEEQAEVKYEQKERRLSFFSTSSLSSTLFLSPPFIAALLFASHPIHTEAVSWIGGIPDLSFTFFCLTSLYVYMHLPAARVPSLDRNYLLSLALFFLATLCKETALAFPLVLIAYDHAMREDRPGPLRRIAGYLPFFAVAAAYFLLRFHALGSLAPVKRHAELSTYQYVINVFPLLRDYVVKLLLPMNLSVFYSFRPVSSVLEASAMSAVIFVAVLTALVLIAYKKNKRVFFFLMLMLIPLLPVLYIPALGENPFAERYLYLPSLGFVLLLSLVFRYARGANPKGAAAFGAAICLLLAIYSAATAKRNHVWKDEHTLWQDAVMKSPDAAIAHYNFGLVLYKEGALDKAIAQYQAALRLQPSPKVYNDLAVAYNDIGLTDRAIELFHVAIQLSPNFADAHNNLGVAYIYKGLYEKAVEHLKIAVRLDPSFSGAYSNLGLSYEGLGMREEAISSYQRALQLDADNATARNNLDSLLSGQRM
jgi:tetratricopeptide (TPR) repeat protein